MEAAICGFAFMGVGLILAPQFLIPAFLCLAVGSALFHVSAGALSALLDPTKTIGAGIFAAPGVIGLACGTVLGLLHMPATVPLLGFVLLGLVLLTSNPFHLPVLKDSVGSFQQPSLGIFLAVTMLFVVGTALRSLIWTDIGAVMIGWRSLLLLGVAAGIGKLLGSLSADRYGRALTIWLSLFLAVIGFVQGSFSCILIGVIGLQASTPIILASGVQWFPKRASLMAGLLLGFGIALGGWLYGVVPLNLIVRAGSLLVVAMFFFGGSILFMRSKNRPYLRTS